MVELRGLDASVEAVAAQKPSILHFATHGFSLPVASDPRRAVSVDGGRDLENVLRRSGLASTAGNVTSKPGRLGVLLAEDVRDLDLRGCELTILSACETALGDPTTGTGLLGLHRAFFVAGARRVLASLWRVDDRATRALLAVSHLGLATSSAPAALTKAQRDATAAGLGPRFWAGFQLYSG